VRTYGALQSHGDGWKITKAEPHVCVRMKNIFQGIGKTETLPFRLSGEPIVTADLHWFLSRYPMAMTDTDKAKLNAGKAKFEHDQAEFTRLLSDAWEPGNVDFKPGYAPYKYQAQAAQLAQKTGRLLIADDVGLGKTITALAAIAEKRFLPAAIVVQAHLAEQWVDEYITPFTHLRAHIIKGRKPYKLPDADVYIFKYSNIAGWVDYVKASPFKAVVFDEIQELRHGFSTNKGQAAKVFVEQAILKIGLSATPVFNYGSEIFNIMQFLAPNCLDTWHSFLIEWCTTHGSHWIVKDPQALGTYLREQFLLIRRTEHDVKGEMPPINTIMHEVAWDQEEAQKSEELARQLALVATTGSFMQRGQAARELDILARHTTGVAKAMEVANFTRILLENKTPLILLGWHRDVYEIWMRELAQFNPVLYTGSESAKQKNKAKYAFIDGETDLFIMSLRSGVGLDGLQKRARTVLFGELDWSPEVHKQVCGRLRRPGQNHQVDAIYLHTDNGSDPVLIDMLGLKASQSHGIMDPTRAAPTKHSDKTRIQKLAEQYLEKTREVA